MIVQVSVVLRRTVSDDIDWRFDNLSGSHHQRQVTLTLMMTSAQVVETSVNVISTQDYRTTLTRTTIIYRPQVLFPSNLLLVILNSCYFEHFLDSHNWQLLYNYDDCNEYNHWLSFETNWDIAHCSLPCHQWNVCLCINCTYLINVKETEYS